MSESPLKTNVDENGIGWVILNRPEVHNCFDEVLIKELVVAFDDMSADDNVRAIVLASEGKSFSAGADLNWMKRVAKYSPEENKADAMVFSGLLKTMNFMKKPLIGLVQGATFGGGVGLVSVCDIVIASEKASFCLSEVKLGIIPAMISPYVVAAMGPRAARRYFVSAERFGAEEAKWLGLVHEVVTADELQAKGDEILKILATNGPKAMGEAKDLVFAVDGEITDDMIDDVSDRIARQRASDEGQEGLGAFLEKRKPNWIKG
ncbi:MAG: enoyl-CoA hydratase/isomerase family protein [Rhodospirillales bacterium]|nr:enoyl-CoA hydratase/isomerase family protein [Rhodospirillales bacterium]